MSDCNHNCESCASNGSCGEQSGQGAIRKEPANALSKIKKVIGVVSGKGGVGKSLVTAMLAVTMRRRDMSVAVLDADITGPSVPKMFGVKGPAEYTEMGILPVFTKTGIRVMSLNLLVDDETEPVVWRGPIIAGTVKQFWTDVVWDEVDYMFVDMPPGTGDVPLTVFQSLPLDGIVVVTSPQELVSMIVKKAVNMAKLMEIPVLGLVENMSYFACPHCGEKLEIFGSSKAEQVAAEYGIPNVARIPVNPDFARVTDGGLVELFEGDALESLADALEKI